MIGPSPLLLSILNAQVPERLYHYTSVSGLDGILNSSTVWASAAQFLNDSKEYLLAIDIARRQMSNLRHKEQDRARARLLEYLNEQWERMEGLEICIFSLSKEGDLLSQWRAYCPPEGGYSIGFIGQQLREIVAPQGGYVAPCVYDQIQQEQLIAEVLAPVLRMLPDVVPDDEAMMKEIGEQFATLLFNQLVIVAPLIKHYSFAEEKEWRLVWVPGRTEEVPIRFRPARGTYIPYVALSLLGKNGKVEIGEIIVGPMLHQYRAIRALTGALQERAVTWAAVRPSQVPYRTW
jgi:hypothetical protein